MTVTPVTSLAQFKEIIASDRPSIFDFWATWCGPCRVISPIFETLSKETTSIDFYKVDVDDASDIAQEVGVRAMPTFVAFRSGNKVDEVVGAVPDKLKALVATASVA